MDTNGEATNEPNTSGALAEVRRSLDELLRSTRVATDAYGRSDLGARIERAISRRADRQLTVVVAGEFKQGKSTLVNSLLNVTVCGVADDVSTVVPTVMRFGTTPAATVTYASPSAMSNAGGDDRRPTTATIDLREVALLGSEHGNPGNRCAIRSIEVELPRRLLQPGLTIVDTPGVGGLDSMHGAVTGAALSLAEVIVFVSDASQPLTGSEIEFLRTGHERCPNLVVVQPKTDIQPAWRHVVATNERILREQGLDIDILPVSSVLRQRAAVERSSGLNDESGFPPLIARLRDAATGDAAQLAERTALADASFVIDQLRATFEHQLAALDDPADADAVIQRLEAAKQHAEHLRSQSAKWQQTLNDGAQDLTSDMDHDLRLRFRAIVTEADNALDANDPTDIWSDFEQWLHRRIGFDLSAHHQLIAERSNQLAETVADHFAADEEALGVQLDLVIPTIAARVLGDDLTLHRAGLTGNALAAVRGSYGGLLMFGMVGQMAGLAMLNPFSVLIGLGLGRRGLREEKRRQLVQRQQQAKMTTRKYLDDINVEAGKTSRDTVRQAHRELRDEFSGRAEQLQATIRDSLRGAEAASKEALTGRQQRLADTRAELDRITVLRSQASAIATALQPMRAGDGS